MSNKKSKSNTMEKLCDPKFKISGQPQRFKYEHEVPKKILDEYDWLHKDEKSNNWLKHNNRWYHLSDFMRVNYNSHTYPKWDGYYSDSFFSGVLIKITDDCKCAYIRTYIN